MEELLAAVPELKGLGALHVKLNLMESKLGRGSQDGEARVLPGQPLIWVPEAENSLAEIAWWHGREGMCKCSVH